MNVPDALSGRAGLEGLRWMLLSGAPHSALRRALGSLLPARSLLGPCRLRDARFQPGYKLKGYYEVHVRADRFPGPSIRPIAVMWTAEENKARREGEADVASFEQEAARRGVLAPFQELVADVPAWGMHVKVSPLDLRFPQLVRLSDPEYVRKLVAAAYAAIDAALGQAPAGGFAVRAIRYRPSSRHVLRYDPLDAPAHGYIFAKLYSDEKGNRMFKVARQAAEWLAEEGVGVFAVRPLAYLAEDCVALYPGVGHGSLAEDLRHPRRSVGRHLEDAGVALLALHRLPQAASGPVELHDFSTELNATAGASAHVPALLPSVGSRIDALLDRAQELHLRLPTEAPTFTHGDFKAEHLWVTPTGLAIIDFDSCHIADPALDVGKLMADLRLWYAAYGQQGLEQAQERFLAGYTRGVPAERLLRARLYEVIELIKVTVRRVHFFERDWAPRTDKLIGQAEALMNGLQLASGLPASQPPSLRSLAVFQSHRAQWRARPPAPSAGGE